MRMTGPLTEACHVAERYVFRKVAVLASVSVTSPRHQADAQRWWVPDEAPRTQVVPLRRSRPAQRRRWADKALGERH